MTRPDWPCRLAGLALMLAVVLGAAGIPASAVRADTIQLVSEEWEGSTNADGSGLYWEIIRAVYEPAGVTMSFDIMPYARAVDQVMNAKADAWVGSYIDEEEGVLYPKYFFDADVVEAVYLSSTFPRFAGQESLKGHKIGWVRGYDYDGYLEVPVNKYELANRISGLRMVEAGRLDALLDAAVEIDNAFKEAKLDPASFERQKVLQLNLYLAFANTDHGKALRAIWDERFPQILQDGTVATLYNKYQWKTWPFDLPRP